MGSRWSRHVPYREWIGKVKGTRSPREQALRMAWGLFLVLGLPFGVMAALGSLATAGIYIEPLRPLWRPWPPDTLKPVIGTAGFVATLAYLCYRIGRTLGYESGNAAGKAMARNLVERGSSAPPPAAQSEIPR